MPNTDTVQLIVNQRPRK